MDIFEKLKLADRKIVSVDLDTNTRITAVPQIGGVMVTICTGDPLMMKREFFTELEAMMKALSLTDDAIEKLSKAF